ncbi:MAG: hypothetical protein FWE77_00805 [Clostridia bacterium]|nr:hypothetical protein [Clostridia bacterium]
MQKMTLGARNLRRYVPPVLYALFFLSFVSGALVLRAELQGFGYLTVQNALFIFALLACFACSARVRQAMFSARHALPASLIALALTAISSFYTTLKEIEDLPLAVTETGAIPAVVLEFVAVFFVCKGLFALFSSAAERCAPASELPPAPEGTRRAFWLGFVFCLVPLTCFWLSLSYPYMDGPDTANQLAQIRGELRLLDLHAPTHTLFLMALLRIVDHFWFVIAVQIALLAVSYGFFGRYLCGRRGMPLHPYGWACAFLLLLTVPIMYTAPWKDTPYTLCIAVLTYFLMRLADDKDWPLTAPRTVTFGLAAAFAFLLRFNGIVVLAGCAVFLAVYAIKRRHWKQLAAFALTLLVAIGGMQVMIYDLFGFERGKNGFAVQTFIFGIASVVMEGGEITGEELDEVDALLGLDWIEANYDPALPRNLIWNPEEWENDLDGFFDDPNHEAYNNLMIVSAGEQPLQVIGLYLRLLPRNLGICASALMYGFRAVWAFTGIFSHLFLLVTLAIAMAVCWPRKALARRWAVFLPIAANVVSIAASTITNEQRYLLPTYTLFVPLLFYILATANAPSKE